MLVTLSVFASLLAFAQAGCDNGCSGHGTCNLDGVCTCHDNWGMGLSHDSGDCSDRICPFEIAWADAPDVDGNRHRYAECAGRGICDRETGNCECFPGYEGKACQRSQCPNSCSGHGQCKYIQDFPFRVNAYDYFNEVYGNQVSGQGQEFSADPVTFNYYGWDHSKSRACVCDPEWGDYDCSKRMCPHGTDIMDHRDNMNIAQKYQKQTFFINPRLTANPTSLDTKTFAFTFRSKLNETFTTTPIYFDVTSGQNNDNVAVNFRRDIEIALESLPNRVIDDVAVTIVNNAASDIAVTIEFTGDNVQGNQYLLTLNHLSCGAGCTPRITGFDVDAADQFAYQSQAADYNSYECGRRGKCNYDTGVCQCFAGYTGAACGIITALV